MIRTHRQPIPHGTAADVRRIVERDYPAAQRAAAMEVLSQYGSEPWHSETVRVHLAALKLARRDIAALQASVLVACRDYRDAIAWAEFPSRSVVSPTLGPDDMKALAASDLHEYRTWLHG